MYLFSVGMRMWLMMNLGVLFVCIGCLFVCLVYWKVVFSVLLEFFLVWMIFMSGSSGVGLKKCMLIMCLGCLVVLVIVWIGIVEVFEVRIVFGLRMWLSLVKRFCFGSSFLMIVLIMRL